MSEIWHHLPQLLTALVVFVLASGSPGPATLAVCQTSASLGRRAGFARAAGIVCGSLFWGLLAAFGLVAALHQVGYLLFVLKLAGGLYLIYLAYKSLRSFMMPNQLVDVAVAPAKLSALFLGGIAIHLTNPKAVFAWGAVITMGVWPGAAWWVSLLIFAVAGTCSASLNFLYAYLFSTSRAAAMYQRARRKVDGFMAVVFGAAGIKLIVNS